MDDERLSLWKTLFERAMTIVDGVDASVMGEWSFGGGTVLMLRHHHRLSKDVDIFVPDAQCLTFLTPRLNDGVEALTTDYLEASNSLKLRFEEGEVDFVASAPLTATPYRMEPILGRSIRVETSTEIIAKKVWYRADLFTGRDIFDLATVAELEPRSLGEITPVLNARRGVILERIDGYGDALREAFDQLDVLDFRKSFDDCIGIVRRVLGPE